MSSWFLNASAAKTSVFFLKMKSMWAKPVLALKIWIVRMKLLGLFKAHCQVPVPASWSLRRSSSAVVVHFPAPFPMRLRSAVGKWTGTIVIFLLSFDPESGEIQVSTLRREKFKFPAWHGRNSSFTLRREKCKFRPAFWSFFFLFLIFDCCKVNSSDFSRPHDFSMPLQQKLQFFFSRWKVCGPNLA